MLEFLKRGDGNSASDFLLISHIKVGNNAEVLNSKHKKSNESSRAKCACCGTILHFPANLIKFRCAICQVTMTLPAKQGAEEKPIHEPPSGLSLSNLQALVRDCCGNETNWSTINKQERCRLLEPVTKYVRNGFHDKNILENSFKTSRKHEMIDFDELAKFYDVLMNLPSRRPFYQLICSCNDLLKKPGEPIREFHWILVIFCNPMVRQCLVFKNIEGFDSLRMRSVSYELTKRCIGYLSNMNSDKQLGKLIHYLKYTRIDILQIQVETLNLYITFHLMKILRRNKKQPKNQTKNSGNLNGSDNIIPYDETSGNILESHGKDLWNMKTASTSNSKDFKFKPFEYGADWHIKTAVRLMLILHKSNDKRKAILNLKFLGSEDFYNMMLDFIDYKQDFSNWKSVTDDRPVFFTELGPSHENKFSMCNYSFLLSLGIKISIMEYEVHKIMEYEAEQAFLTSLDKGQNVAVYLRIRVRRAHIANDSLLCIKNHQKDLMKSLRVEFINEPGIDAGGLRKEWFLLLTKALFNPMNGLFTCNEESRFSWPSISPLVFNGEERAGGNGELYYLFGIVIGLAIFNGTILDLQFPKAFYKKLCGEVITFNDYLELYPETGRNLLKMLEYEGEDFFETFGVCFETTVYDGNLDMGSDHYEGKSLVNVELCEKGRDIEVTQENKHLFITKWVDFYMNQSISLHFGQFMKGFHQIFENCESITLFNSEELEKLVCGNQDNNCYDFQMLRSVTKYVGGFTDKSKVINWFWDIVNSWDLKTQKKLLHFISGSDRVPPTGISTLPFKISRLGNGNDSNKLPLAHTCFNELCIWNYGSKEKLENKLWWAVTQSEGYAFK